MIDRRTLIASGLVGTAAVLAGRADACSLVADRRLPFSDRQCRRALAGFVDFLNAGPEMTMAAIVERADELSVALDSELVDDVVPPHSGTTAEDQYRFYQTFRLAGGRLDPRPIRLVDINRIRRLHNRATYQFTLERYSYHPADWEGCNGLFVHDEYYGIERRAYLATFTNNRLRSVRTFPEWYLEERTT